MDEELAMRLHEEEKAKLEKMQRERAAKEEASNVALIAEFDDKGRVERRMMTVKCKQKVVRRDQEQNMMMSVKKQKLEGDAEKEELRACLDIVLGDDIAINVESLATKYPIVDWKTHILTENMMYYQIIRADGSSKNYKIFSEMLDDFDR
ncbi:hypothetical protein Tco_0417037 [Tanacetum coccineum]